MTDTVTVKTADLIDRPLDWVVAKIEKPAMLEWPDNPVSRPQSYTFRPSTDWAHGGLIIERERISVVAPTEKFKSWQAAKSFADTLATGGAPLIAAMRCYVASRLGNEVEVPRELLGANPQETQTGRHECGLDLAFCDWCSSELEVGQTGYCESCRTALGGAGIP